MTPSNGHVESTAAAEDEEKTAAPQYEMIEEGDDRWDDLEDSNPSADKAVEHPAEEKHTLDKAQ